jgi:peptidyl-prolyl cis-trans isomerase-like 3
MEAVEVDKKGRPKEPFRIEKVTIHANPLAE